MTDHRRYILRCIELAEQAVDVGELPFAGLLVRDNKVVVEASNTTIATNDVTNHAEILVLREAQKKMGTNLRDCTIYSNYEPCAMCSFMIRELQVGCVVFAVPSPLMGGYSRWDILQDAYLETMPKYYGKVPEIVAGLMEEQASKTFQRHERQPQDTPSAS